jgi:2-keto-4-pentenoate hydratase/2-oxohepta-3-ene-1,7-dioic acid hydratase in catechol pathway
MSHVRFRDPAGSVRKGSWTNDGIVFADSTYDLDEVDILPPTEPSKIACVGLNYSIIEGYTCVNDISNRDDQMVEQNWIRGKAFDGSAPIGPVVAPPDEVPDDATVELRLNGTVKQRSSRSEFIFSVPEIVEEITTYMTLEPGDIIITGTPAGVGPLSDGDRVEVEIEGVGTLEHEVRTD